MPRLLTSQAAEATRRQPAVGHLLCNFYRQFAEVSERLASFLRKAFWLLSHLGEQMVSMSSRISKLCLHKMAMSLVQLQSGQTQH